MAPPAKPAAKKAVSAPARDEPSRYATTVRFSPALKAALEKAAKADMRTTSQLIQKILTEWLTERNLF